MNVEIGTDTPIFLFWEYLFQIFSSAFCLCSVAKRVENIWDLKRRKRARGGKLKSFQIVGGWDKVVAKSGKMAWRQVERQKGYARR
jgi:hypothetical protein